jgi:polyhydroxyalkanoate synthesis regulator phasin
MSEEHNQRREDLARQIRQQEAWVRRMVMRGTPSQADEDRLRALERQLADLESKNR